MTAREEYQKVFGTIKNLEEHFAVAVCDGQHVRVAWVEYGNSSGIDKSTLIRQLVKICADPEFKKEHLKADVMSSL